MGTLVCLAANLVAGMVGRQSASDLPEKKSQEFRFSSEKQRANVSGFARWKQKNSRNSKVPGVFKKWAIQDSNL